VAARVGGDLITSSTCTNVVSLNSSVAMGSTKGTGTNKHINCVNRGWAGGGQTGLGFITGQSFDRCFFIAVNNTNDASYVPPILTGTVAFTFCTFDLTAKKGTSSLRGAIRCSGTAGTVNLTCTDSVILLSSDTSSTALCLFDQLVGTDTITIKRNLIQGTSSQPYINYHATTRASAADLSFSGWQGTNAAYDTACTRYGAYTSTVGSERVTSASLSAAYVPLSGSYAIDSTNDKGLNTDLTGKAFNPFNDKGAYQATSVTTKSYSSAVPSQTVFIPIGL
jgi:hypothetical protein